MIAFSKGVGIAALAFLLVSCSPFPKDAATGDQAGASAEPQPAESPEQLATRLMPPIEKNLSDLMAKEISESESAKNDIVSDAIADRYNATRCRLVSGLTNFSDWTGTVRSIYADGRMEASMAGEVTTTFVGDVARSSPLFGTVADLTTGEAVRVSGTFDGAPVESQEVDGCRFSPVATAVLWTDIKRISG